MADSPQRSDKDLMTDLMAATPARLGAGRSGVRPTTSSWLKFRLDHAAARDAIKTELSPEFIEFAKTEKFPIVQSSAIDKDDFIAFPPKGKVTDLSLLTNCPRDRDVQIVISDGLSSFAIQENIRDVLPMIIEGFEQNGITCGVPIVVRYGRVAVADQIAHHLGMKLAINLIGERPGLSAADSMSAYLTYNPGPQTISSDRTVISNIHSRGMLPIEAGAHIVQIARRILDLKVSGVRLQQLS